MIVLDLSTSMNLIEKAKEVALNLLKIIDTKDQVLSYTRLFVFVITDLKTFWTLERRCMDFVLTF